MPQLTDLARPEYWLNIGSPARGCFIHLVKEEKRSSLGLCCIKEATFHTLIGKKSLAILLSVMSDRTKQKIPATSEAPLSRVLYREEEGEMECPLSAQVPAESRPRKMP